MVEGRPPEQTQGLLASMGGVVLAQGFPHSLGQSALPSQNPVQKEERGQAEPRPQATSTITWKPAGEKDGPGSLQAPRPALPVPATTP